MSIKEIYKEANTHAVIKKTDAPITTSDVRPSMYDLLAVPATLDNKFAEYIDNDTRALLRFIMGIDNE